MGIISVLKLSALFLIFAPVMVMLFYLRYFNTLEDKNSYQDQFADSFYSLGFLLTLTALVCTFFPLFWGDHAITMEETLGNFGVALFTTLLGLTVRIYLTSFSTDLEQLQKQTVLELERDVRFFKEEMWASIGVMREFNTELEKTTRKTVEDFGASLAGAGQEITGLVQVTMKNAFNPLTKTFANLAAEVETATADFGKDLDSSFKHCVESVQAIALEPELLRETLKPVLHSLEEAATDIDKSVQHISDSLEKSSGSLDSATNDFSSSVAAMNTGLTSAMERMIAKVEAMELNPDVFNRMLEDSFSSFKTAVSHVAEQTRLHGNALEKSAEAVNSALPVYDTVAANMAKMTDLNKELEASMQQMAEVSSIFSNVAGNLNTLTSVTGEYVSTIKSSVDIHKAKSKDLSSEHQSIKDIREKLETQYQKAHTALDNLVRAFVDVAQFVQVTLKERA